MCVSLIESFSTRRRNINQLAEVGKERLTNNKVIIMAGTAK
jgi:hypothetical protein